jgi:hypothetical protein
MLKVASASTGDLKGLLRVIVLSFASRHLLEEAIVSPVIRIINRINLGRATADQAALLPPLQANFPATAEPASPRSNVQERG